MRRFAKRIYATQFSVADRLGNKLNYFE